MMTSVVQAHVVELALCAALAIIAATLLVRRLRAASPRTSSPSIAATEANRQVAALPVRRGADGALEVLVISTRGSGRWTIPKGWPMIGRTDPESAAQEAYEEAGLRGIVSRDPMGRFEYSKRRDEQQLLLVTVYRLDVEHQVRRWRERGQRKMRWLSPSRAAECIAWPGLAEIIRSVETPGTAGTSVVR